MASVDADQIMNAIESFKNHMLVNMALNLTNLLVLKKSQNKEEIVAQGLD